MTQVIRAKRARNIFIGDLSLPVVPASALKAIVIAFFAVSAITVTVMTVVFFFAAFSALGLGQGPLAGLENLWQLTVWYVLAILAGI